MSVYYIKCAMTKREGHLEKGPQNQVQQCFVVVFLKEGGTFNSTKGRVTVRVGDGGEQGEGV